MTDARDVSVDTGPLSWSRPPTTIGSVVAHTIIGTCTVMILTMLIAWGFR